MTDEQIKQKAERYAETYVSKTTAYIGGAHSRDEEIKELQKENLCMESLLSMHRKMTGEYELKLQKFNNPWISVDTVMTEKDYPEIRNNPNDIWERSEDLLVITKEGKLEIAYFEIHRNNNPISSHGDYLLWYKRDKEYDSKVELYGDREVIKWMPINCEI